MDRLDRLVRDNSLGCLTKHATPEIGIPFRHGRDQIVLFFNLQHSKSLITLINQG